LLCRRPAKPSFTQSPGQQLPWSSGRTAPFWSQASGGGSAHLLQLREKLVTALIGLFFLGSAAIGRPLIYQLARASLARRKPSELAAFEALRDNPDSGAP
jgi:hypothetical protein